MAMPGVVETASYPAALSVAVMYSPSRLVGERGAVLKKLATRSLLLCSNISSVI